jgi:hypothetical protein
LIGVRTRSRPPPSPPPFVGFESLAKSSIFLANSVAFTLLKTSQKKFQKEIKVLLVTNHLFLQNFVL